MDDLKSVDMVALSKAVGDPLRIDLNDRIVVEDALSRVRLQDHELVGKDGTLTQKGISLFKQVKNREDRLRDGIPFIERLRRNPKTAIASVRPWVKGSLGKIKAVTNGELLYVGQPVEGMSINHASKVDVRRVVAKLLQQKMVEVFPHSYQVEELGGIELIWMTDKEQNRMIAVQAKYFDFVCARYPRAQYMMTEDGRAVQGNIPGKGFGNGVVAIIMAVEIDEKGSLRPPQKRKGWEANGKAVQEDTVSTDEVKRGSIRGK